MHLGGVTEITEVLELVFDKDNVGCSIIIDIKGVSSYKKRMMSRSKATVTPHRVRHVQCSSMKIKIRFPELQAAAVFILFNGPSKKQGNRCPLQIWRWEEETRIKIQGSGAVSTDLVFPPLICFTVPS